MSIAEPLNSESEVPPYPVRRWTVREYERFTAQGVLSEDDGVELLEGWIVLKRAKNPLHDSTVDQIQLTLSRALPAGWYVRVQNVIETADSEPEPDICVVRGQPKDYMRRHPQADDIALVIEVADSSLARDRQKRHLYARAAMRNYWIINLSSSQVEAYSAPVGEGRDADFQYDETLSVNQSIALQLAESTMISLQTADLLPAPD